jgi:hypothetical protein
VASRHRSLSLDAATSKADHGSTDMTTDAAVGGVVDNLVTQFASALDCFRELVQNSIDAGTSRVDIWSEFQAGDGHVGTIAFHVDDFGEGMDEKIIDNQLTRLFASTKENDLTKIGKFGIGFVSVFALKPKGVLLHTGRGGEYWEVFFHEDRSFSKSTLDNPVEGTQITIFLEGDYHRYRDLVEGVRETLQRWCRHSETEVTFEDRSPMGDAFPELEIINEPFEVAGECMTEFQEEGTRMVMAYDDRPVYGFYNRGLTLAYTEIADKVFEPSMARRFALVSVKIKSRYLEHTLARDSVMRDEQYHTAMNRLREVANAELLPMLISRIEDVAHRKDFDIDAMRLYARLFEFLMNEPEDVVREILLERPVFRTLHGDKPYSPHDVWRSLKTHGHILVAEDPTALTNTLHREGVPVFVGYQPNTRTQPLESHPLSFVRGALARYVTMRAERTLIGSVKKFLGFAAIKGLGEVIKRPQDAYLNVTVDAQAPDDMRPLLDGARRLLEEVGIGYRALATCVPAVNDANPPLFVTAKKLASIMRRPSVIDVSPQTLEAAVNRHHPYVKKLVKLHADQPAIAEYCLARALLLHRDEELDRDAQLMEAAHAAHNLLPNAGTA